MAARRSFDGLSSCTMTAFQEIPDVLGEKQSAVDPKDLVPRSMFLVADRFLVLSLDKSPALHVWMLAKDMTTVSSSMSLAMGGRVLSCWCDKLPAPASAAATLWCLVERADDRCAIVRVEVPNTAHATAKVVGEDLLPEAMAVCTPALDLQALFHENQDATGEYFARS